MVVVSTPTIVGVEARGCHCHRMTSGMGVRPRSVVARSSPNAGSGAGGWWWALPAGVVVARVDAAAFVAAWPGAIEVLGGPD